MLRVEDGGRAGDPKETVSLPAQPACRAAQLLRARAGPGAQDMESAQNIRAN